MRGIWNWCVVVIANSGNKGFNVRLNQQSTARIRTAIAEITSVNGGNFGVERGYHDKQDGQREFGNGAKQLARLSQVSREGQE